MMKQLLAFLALVTVAHGAGSVQQSLQQLGNTNNWVLAFLWTGDASTGSVPVTVGQGLNCCTGYLVVQVETTPGTPNPTAGYSVAIQDSSGADVLNGAAGSLSATTPQSFAASTSAPPLQGVLNLVITGQSVASAKGTVYVFLSKPGTINTARLGLGGGSSSANWLTLSNPPFPDNRVYNFTPQSPGGSLSIGSNTINMVPCPIGVNGTNTKHFLYIQGGTGAAEAVPITGGTCLSGAAAGTLTITTANTHTGAWSIGSATCGITEDEYSFATGSGATLQAQGIVFMPVQTCTVQGAIPYMRYVSFWGMGKGTKLVPPGCSNTVIFDSNLPAHASSQPSIIRDDVTFDSFLISAASCGSGVNSVFGIREILSPGTTDLYGIAGLKVNRMDFENVYNAIYMHRAEAVLVTNSTFYAAATAFFNTPAPTTDNPFNSFEIFFANDQWLEFCLNATACTTFGISGFSSTTFLNCNHCQIFSVTGTFFQQPGGASTSGPIAIGVGGASEDIDIDDVTIESPVIGIQFYPITNNSTVYNPGYIGIHKVAIDQIWFTAIQTSIGTSLTDFGGTHNMSITDCEITNPVLAQNTVANGINLQNFTRNVQIANNKVSGWQATNTQQAITVGSQADSINIHDNIFGSLDSTFTGGTSTAIFVLSNATNIKLNNNLCIFFDTCINDSADTVASAATITLPTWRNQVYISGTTTITTINTCAAAQKNYVTTLMFGGTISVTKGSNLHLASNFGPTTTDGTLTLICDGSNWREIGRAVN